MGSYWFLWDFMRFGTFEIDYKQRASEALEKS
jgi:hypothetical protein